MGRDRIKQGDRKGCVKCGTCQTVCPVFSVRPDESSAARGKMALSEAVDQGLLAESEIYRGYLEKCLLCGACTTACPAHVPTADIVLEGRRKLRGKRHPLMARAVTS